MFQLGPHYLAARSLTLRGESVLIICIEVTEYSRSLPSSSGTAKSNLSFLMRNSARSPAGNNTGCFSSRGRMRYITRSVFSTYSWQSISRCFLCAPSVPRISPAKLLPLFSSIPQGTASIFEMVPVWRNTGSSLANAKEPSIKKQTAIVDFMAPPVGGSLKCRLHATTRVDAELRVHGCFFRYLGLV